MIQIRNPSTNDIQVTELELYQDSNDIFTVETSNLYSTTNPFGELLGTTNSQGSPIIRFKPTDTFDSDYDLKFIKNTFNSSLTGIGTLSVGFVNLVGVNTTVGVGTTPQIIISRPKRTNSSVNTSSSSSPDSPLKPSISSGTLPISDSITSSKFKSGLNKTLPTISQESASAE